MYLRHNISTASFDVALGLEQSPFLTAYLFDREYKAQFAVPVPPLPYLPGTFPPAAFNESSVKISPTNQHVHITGESSNDVRTYDMGRDDFTNGIDFSLGADDPTYVAFPDSADKVVIGTDDGIAQYAYSGSTIGAQDWSTAYGHNPTGPSIRKIYVLDDFIVAMIYRGKGGDAFLGRVHVYRRSDGVVTDSFASISSDDPLALSLAPQRLANGNNVVAYVQETGVDMMELIEPAGTLNPYLQLGALNEYAFGGFATNNRLILARRTLPYSANNPVTGLECWKLEPDGALSLHFSTPFTAGGPFMRAMQYHGNEEILFLGTSGAPFLHAIPLYDDGFGMPLATPSPALASAVLGITIRYGSGWFNYSM